MCFLGINRREITTFLVDALGYNIDLFSMAAANAKLLLLSFLMRGMLCTWEDVFDQDIDRQVARTRIWPLARRAIFTTNAMTWILVQTVVALGTFFSVLPFSPSTSYTNSPSA